MNYKLGWGGIDTVCHNIIGIPVTDTIKLYNVYFLSIHRPLSFAPLSIILVITYNDIYYSMYYISVWL